MNALDIKQESVAVLSIYTKESIKAGVSGNTLRVFRSAFDSSPM